LDFGLTSGYLLLGTLATVDGNLISQIAAGAFKDLWYAAVWGLLCYSGVGCWSILTFNGEPIDVKLSAIALTRILAFIMSMVFIPVGLLFGGFILHTNYIAAAVIITVATLIICGALGFKIPTLKLRWVEVPPPLLSMAVSTAVVFMVDSKMCLSSINTSDFTDAITPISGITTAIAIASLSEVAASLAGHSLVCLLSGWMVKALRLYGGLTLALLGGLIAGLLPLKSNHILLLYISGCFVLGASVVARKLLLRRG
jgi:hypothetical protein